MPNWDFDKFGLVFRKNQPKLMADHITMKWYSLHHVNSFFRMVK